MTSSTRSGLLITYTTWKALFLREALSRLFAGRIAWLWLLLEPLVQVGIMLVIFVLIRMRSVSGMETSAWLMVGIMAFLMFRRTGSQGQNAVTANQGLFSYRQVKPVDTVLVRAGMEGMLTMTIAIILFVFSLLFNVQIMPDSPILLLEAMLALWLLGMGYGLITSVAGELIPELGKVIGFFMTPLYFLSGVIFPIAATPLPYREWIFLNPVAHGVEFARMGVSSYYRSAPELDLGYMYMCALVSLFLGLALHVRFSNRLIAK